MPLAAEPTGKTNWADNDVPDGPGGNNNKIEPPVSFQDSGYAYKQKPPREVWNGWQNNVHVLLEWLKTAVIDHEAAIVSLGGTSSAKIEDLVVSSGSAYVEFADHGIPDPVGFLRNSLGKQVDAEITIDGTDGITISTAIDGTYTLIVK